MSFCFRSSDGTCVWRMKLGCHVWGAMLFWVEPTWKPWPPQDGRLRSCLTSLYLLIYLCGISVTLCTCYFDDCAAFQREHLLTRIVFHWSLTAPFLSSSLLTAMIPRRLIIVAFKTRDHPDGVFGTHCRLGGLCCVNHIYRDAMGLVRCGWLAKAEQFVFIGLSLVLPSLSEKTRLAVMNHLRIPLREVFAFERLKVIVTLSRSFTVSVLFYPI